MSGVWQVLTQTQGLRAIACDHGPGVLQIMTSQGLMTLCPDPSVHTAVVNRGPVYVMTEAGVLDWRGCLIQPVAAQLVTYVGGVSPLVNDLGAEPKPLGGASSAWTARQSGMDPPWSGGGWHDCTWQHARHFTGAVMFPPDGQGCPETPAPRSWQPIIVPGGANPEPRFGFCGAYEINTSEQFQVGAGNYILESGQYSQAWRVGRPWLSQRASKWAQAPDGTTYTIYPSGSVTVVKIEARGWLRPRATATDTPTVDFWFVPHRPPGGRPGLSVQHVTGLEYKWDTWWTADPAGIPGNGDLSLGSLSAAGATGWREIPAALWQAGADYAASTGGLDLRFEGAVVATSRDLYAPDHPIRLATPTDLPTDQTVVHSAERGWAAGVEFRLWGNPT